MERNTRWDTKKKKGRGESKRYKKIKGVQKKKKNSKVGRSD